MNFFCLLAILVIVIVGSYFSIKPEIEKVANHPHGLSRKYLWTATVILLAAGVAAFVAFRAFA